MWNDTKYKTGGNRFMWNLNYEIISTFGNKDLSAYPVLYADSNQFNNNAEHASTDTW